MSETADRKPLELALLRLHAGGNKTVRANMVADELWPDARHHNANGQVFNLASGVAGRMLRNSNLVIEVENRVFEIIPERLNDRRPRTT